MHRWWLISIAGILCFASGCESKTPSQSSEHTPTDEVATLPAVPTGSDAANSASESPQPLTGKDFFPNPLVSASTTLQPVVVPNLIPPTASTERIPQVDTGRPDPFASLSLTPTVTKAKSAPAAPVQAPPTVSAVPAAPTTLPTVTVAAQPLPVSGLPLPSLLPTANLAPLPTLDATQFAPQQSLAEAIEISGVVQVAGKTSVIIKDPNEHTSRPVTVGERVGNGKVLVKRVELGLEPVVILEQDGREIVRSIGSSSALVGAL